MGQLLHLACMHLYISTSLWLAWIWLLIANQGKHIIRYVLWCKWSWLMVTSTPLHWWLIFPQALGNPPQLGFLFCGFYFFIFEGKGEFGAVGACITLKIFFCFSQMPFLLPDLSDCFPTPLLFNSYNISKNSVPFWKASDLSGFMGANVLHCFNLDFIFNSSLSC